MNNISYNHRYLPHTLDTKFHATKFYRYYKDLNLTLRKYKISKASLMRWNKLFDGTKDSLIAKPHKPLSPHPNAHNNDEVYWINNYLRRLPHISLNELYGKLRINKGYSRHASSLFRFLRKSGFYKAKKSIIKIYIPKPYNTPKDIGIKWQLDVKYVPKACKVNILDDNKYYQYTVIDEASRERFIYPYKEQSSYSTIDFVKRAIVYFGYKPLTIQTDNGFEFTHFKKTKMIHPFDILCDSLDINHQLIRPRTPRHNGKVERSHRNDNERFYKYLKFYSFEDLKKEMKRYLNRSNNIPMQTLNWLTPIEKRKQLKNNT